MKYNYDPESDVLSVTLKDKAFDYAAEMGDFIVHFSKNHQPVYLEILNASSFLTKATNSLPKSSRQEVIDKIQSL